MSIDRKQLVKRHHPVVHGVEKLAPLSIGNGEFAFSTDITGLQTFADEYDVPIGTQSQWGWHYTGKPGLYNENDIVMQSYDTYGRSVQYPMRAEGKETAYHWLRQNPHRLHLGRLAFRFMKEDGHEASVADIEDIEQELNLWEGVIYSSFRVQGVPVSVTTVCHPDNDQIGVQVRSPLVSAGRLQLMMRFPAPDMTAEGWANATHLDWGNEHRHETVVHEEGANRVRIERSMDEDGYVVQWKWQNGHLEKSGTHTCLLYPSKESESFTCCVGFAPREATEAAQPVEFATMLAASKQHWAEFWSNGGALDLSDSKDSRAQELERRIVLSQFVTAAHGAGSLPPQETGLMYNSWFGKMHLEMHWWHAAHFPLWDRSYLLEKSMDWYTSILPLAKELAQSQGYEGARWPKMVGVDGKQSPSPVAPMLIWQQPHPMTLAELCYRANPQQATLERWKDVVFESADFMVSYAVWDDERQAHVLGPPLIPAQECHKPEVSMNPPYELEYWKYGLEIALKWAERLGVPAKKSWKYVASTMALPPQVNGVYLAHENRPDTFTDFNRDHPSMLGAYGILPGTMIDREVMRRTLDHVWEDWQWPTAWGWDFPMCAMTAARLGDGQRAVDFLLLDEIKNTYLVNGHNYQRPGLSAYLPGNGGLLTAVSLMAAGWQGGPSIHAPGFPQDGSWTVTYEKLNPWL